MAPVDPISNPKAAGGGATERGSASAAEQRPVAGPTNPEAVVEKAGATNGKQVAAASALEKPKGAEVAPPAGAVAVNPKTMPADGEQLLELARSLTGANRGLAAGNPKKQSPSKEPLGERTREPSAPTHSDLTCVTNTDGTVALSISATTNPLDDQIRKLQEERLELKRKRAEVQREMKKKRRTAKLIIQKTKKATDEELIGELGRRQMARQKASGERAAAVAPQKPPATET